ncbi:PH domain-containing protein [Rhodococcus spongiicola]|uniref:Uncharacterized protein n=1 Tax=Rhodococcus spongiicola TaxID=2487352 RepID=A0A3S3BLX2_9NOCA|nr:PH domain-containing protein [Rhodococcus spongiicola]RVW04421.1 hypothetical protein EF834_04875 [Rhodococcus spongiicola]
MAVPFPWGKHLKRTSGLPIGASDVIMLVVALIPAVLLAVAGSWAAALGVGIFGMTVALPVMAAHANTRTKVLSSRVRSVDVDPRTGRVRAADQSAPPAPGAVRGVLFPHSWIRVLTLLCLGAFMLLVPWFAAARFRDPATGSWGIDAYVIAGICALPALAAIAVAVATVRGWRYGITVVDDGVLVSNPLFARMIPWQQIAGVRPTRNREGRIPVDMICLDLVPGTRPVRLPSGMLGRLTMLFVPQTRSKIELPFQHFDVDPVLLLNLLYDLHTQPPLRAEIVDGRIFEYLRSMLAQPR